MKNDNIYDIYRQIISQRNGGHAGSSAGGGRGGGGGAEAVRERRLKNIRNSKKRQSDADARESPSGNQQPKVYGRTKKNIADRPDLTQRLNDHTRIYNPAVGQKPAPAPDPAPAEPADPVTVQDKQNLFTSVKRILCLFIPWQALDNFKQVGTPVKTDVVMNSADDIFAQLFGKQQDVVPGIQQTLFQVVNAGSKQDFKSWTSDAEINKLCNSILNVLDDDSMKWTSQTVNKYTEKYNGIYEGVKARIQG